MPQPSWQTFPTGSPNTLIVVDVVNPMVIWAAGGGFNDAVNDGTVVRTEDGGHTWEIVTPPDGTPHVFRDVEAFNPNHAVVLASETGMDSCGQLKPSRISATPNGGNNWQTVFDANQGDYYDSLAFFDHRRGLAVSDPPIPNGDKFPILATDDGGDNWSLVQPTGMPDAEVGEFGRATGTCLVAVGPRDAWFGTAFNKDLAPNAKARVFRTQDGGQSWKVVTTPIPGQPTGIVSLSFRDP